MPRELRDALRTLAPVAATVTVITTLVACVAITKARDVYVGGLTWPYFSDMGRDPPAYYVFCVGLSLVAVTLAATWLANAEFQRRALAVFAATRGVRAASTTATTLAVVGVVALPVLAIFDTSSYPSVHNAAAYAFFLLQTIAVTINTVVTHRLVAAAKRVQTGAVPHAPLATDGAGLDRQLASVRRTFHAQLALWTLFFVAFVVYLPVGLAVIQPFQRLTIAQCLAKALGQAYCTDEMKYSATETTLWNYEDDFAANQMRSAAQLACILTLVGYTLTFTTHDTASVAKTTPDAVHAQA